MFRFNNLSNDGRRKIDDLTDDIIVAYYDNLLKSAFKTRYLMTSDQTSQLESMLDPTPVIPDSTRPPKYSQHPVLANLNDYCYFEAQKYVDICISNGYNVMTIGDSVNQKLDKGGVYNIHNCLLTDSSRDSYRVVNSLAARPSAPHRTAHLHKAINNVNTFGVCNNGTLACNHQANVAIAVHSLYDFSLDDIYRVFQTHGIMQLIAFLYVPFQLYDARLAPVDAKVFNIQYVNDNKDLVFGMKDSSIPYVHSRKKWADLAHVTVITHEHSPMNIVRETVRTAGQLQTIIFTRTFDFDAKIAMTVPIAKWCNGNYLVPDVVEFIKKGPLRCRFYKTQRDLKHFLVPSHVVDGLLAYSQRAADESYQFKEVATLAQGYKRMLKIGDKVFFENWEVDPDSYFRVVISLFIIGAVYRTERTQNISLAFKEIKAVTTRGFISKHIHHFGRRFANFLSELGDINSGKVDESIPTVNQRGGTPISNPTAECSFGFINKDTQTLITELRVVVPKDYTAYLIHICSNSVPAAGAMAAFMPITPGVSAPPPPPPPGFAGVHRAAGFHVHAGALGGAYVSAPPPVSSSPLSGSLLNALPMIDISDIEPERSHVHGKSLGINVAHLPRRRSCTPHYMHLTASARNSVSRSSSLSLSPSRSRSASQSKTSNSLKPEPGYQILNTAGSLINNTGISTPNTTNMPSLTATVGPSINDDTDDDTISQQSFRPVVASRKAVISLQQLRGTQSTLMLDDPSITNEIRNKQYPKHFRVGHCAMQSVYEAYYNRPSMLNKKQAISEFIRLCYGLFLGSGFSNEDTNRYIYCGDWGQTQCSQFIIVQLAVQLNVVIAIHSRLSTEPLLVGTDSCTSGERISIYHAANHYSSVGTGGAVDRATSLADEIYNDTIAKMAHNGEIGLRFEKDKRPLVFIDLSSAPGHMAASLAEYFDQTHFADNNDIIPDVRIKLISFVYDGPCAVKMHNKNLDRLNKVGVKPQYYKTHTELAKHIQGISKNHRIIGILNDAATETDVDIVCKSITDAITPVLKTVNNYTTYYCSAENNPIYLWHLTIKFVDSGIYDGLNCLWMQGYTGIDRMSVEDVYLKSFKEETQHRVSIPKRRILDHANSLFSEILKDHRASVLSAIKNGLSKEKSDVIAQFSAITGFASASKTTKAVTLYPKGTFISPTKHLQESHVRKGVSSMTPHNAILHMLRNPLYDGEIVVDECSQFFVEYVHILQSIAPAAHIIILGDVYQTPAVNYNDKREYTRFKDVGVVNNLWITFKIPHDVTKLLNEKYGYNMIPKSGVLKGLAVCVDFSLKAKTPVKFPIIAFNRDSAKNLSEAGYNAHTITTYTGSRDHTIGFYVDSAAIASNITSKPEWVYTAMTRATDKIVLMGNDSEVIQRYFALNGHYVETMFDLNNAYLMHENRTKFIEEQPNLLPLAQEDEGLVPSTADVDEVVLIAQKVCAAANATDTNYILDPRIPKVEEGVLRTNIDVAMEPPKTRQVFRVVPNISLVKKQLSDSPARTLQTMVKRYSKRTISMSPSDTTFLQSEIAKGLSKALSGREDNYSDFLKFLAENRDNREIGLNKQLEEYYKSLDKKMGENSNVKKVIEKPFNEFDEVLEFFNKRQVKYDPKAKFDQSDKVGQGVASMSKVVNILFSCYARYILDAARLYAKKCGKNIILATHGSDADFDKLYKQFMNNLPTDRLNHKWSNNDWSEWDSRFLKEFAQIMWQLNKACGCPEYLAGWFLEFRKKWSMSYQCKNGRSKLTGKNKQFSGNPYTLCENTIFNMALTNAVLDIISPDLEIYKGDDASIKAALVRYSAKAARILKLTGHTAKLHMSDSGEFAGFVLTRAGIFPDVLRYAAKFLDKDYRDEKHFEEALCSLKERLSPVTSEFQKHMGCLALTEFYPELTAGEFETIFDFLKDSQNIKFSSLTTVTKEEIIPDKC